MNNFDQRISNTQLPGAVELEKILTQESQRAVALGKEQKHYADFSVAIQWFRRFGIDTNIFEQEFSSERKSYHRILQEGRKIVDELVAKILQTNLDEKDIYFLNAVYDYLSEEDYPKEADILFVFGSKTRARIDKAIELYNLGLAKQLMISGDNPFYNQNQLTVEADRYTQYAIDKGIPSENIITENKSISVPDNVRSSLNMLDDKGIKYRSFLLVNSPYTQRRGWIHFKKYLPETIKVTRVNSITIEKFQKDKWFTNQDSLRILANEFIKMKIAVTMNTA